MIPCRRTYSAGPASRARSRPWSILSLSLVIGIACTEVKPRQAPVSPAAAAVASPAVATPTATLCPADAHDERAALRCAEGAVTRVGDTLSLLLVNGTLRQFVNSAGREASDYWSYDGLLRGRGGAPSFHLLSQSNGEWGGALLLDAATGDTMRLTVAPVMSPDSTHFVILAVDENLCQDSTAFAVWRVTAGWPVREWVAHASCGTARNWTAKPLPWHSPDTLRLSLTVPRILSAPDPGDSGWAHQSAFLVRHAAGWSLDHYPAAVFCQDTSEIRAFACAGHSPPRRHGDTLVVRVVGGRPLVRSNVAEDGEQHGEYRYVGLMRGGDGDEAYHVLDFHGYESGAVELINTRSGDSLVVASIPLLAPDRRRFAIVAESHEIGEGVTVLEVWRLSGPRPAREFTIRPFDCSPDRGWWPGNEVWRSKDTLAFWRFFLPREKNGTPGAVPDSQPALLVRQAIGWSLDSASLAHSCFPPDAT